MKILKKTFAFILKVPVYIYKWIISPLLPHSCRFYPTCSNYMLQAISMHGIRGVKMGLKRLLKCRPKCKHYGYDPVPINIKGEAKWLI